MSSLPFVRHLIVNPDGSLPDIPNCLYAYIMAGNGIFVYAKRPGLEVLIPASSCKIAALPEVISKIAIAQQVPADLLEQSLYLSRQVFPGEALFWFHWTEQWSLYFPAQKVTHASTVPCDRYHPTGFSALIDLHSHARFAPFFSPTDDRDETGFRIYAVIGNLDKTPTISVRVGVYSHYFNIPASTIFELPDGLCDLYKLEEVEYEDQ